MYKWMHQNNSDSSSEKEYKDMRMAVILIFTVFSFSNGFFYYAFHSWIYYDTDLLIWWKIVQNHKGLHTNRL